MKFRRAFLAVPGDLMTPTGGYLYDRRLLAALRALDRDITHIALPRTFPEPSPADLKTAAEQLVALPPAGPVIVDGLAFGAMDPATTARIRAPIVALVHHPLAEESGLDPARRDALYRSERDNLALAARVVVTSRHTAELLTSRYGVGSGRITVARPGVDPPSGESRAADPPLILSVGILVPRKGHDLLLRALEKIADRPWQAVIVGATRDKCYARQLAQLAATDALGRRVRMAGCVDAEELARLYQRASIFALATRYEGHGIVFDEASMHGLPIVSCTVGAVPETVAPGSGCLVPPEDPDALAKALDHLLGDATLRSTMAAASKRAGAALRGWDDTARRVAAVIDSVSAGS
ncbi:MAG: glycosyltransferase family 4 protein [Pseudomonadota bacterium]